MAAQEVHKQAEIASRTPSFMARERSKPFGWEPDHWVKWATVADAIRRLGIPEHARVLDVGCGSGWTSLFLAEAGHDVTGVDLVPANIELCRERAAAWGLDDGRARFEVADMDSLELEATFDLALVFDSLHHTINQPQALAGVARHLRAGGWVLIGEPSWLHHLSPGAKAVTRERGWLERGVTARSLKRDCTRAGLGDFRRFFQGTQPYESRTREFLWQLVRLVSANFAMAPQAEVWVAARKPA